MLLKFFGNFNLKKWFINKIMYVAKYWFFQLSSTLTEKVQNIFNAIFAIFEVLASLWNFFYQITLTPWKTYSCHVKSLFRSQSCFLFVALLYLKRYCHQIQDKTIPGTKANPWNYYVMGLKRWIKLIIKKRFIHIRLTSTKKTDR